MFRNHEILQPRAGFRGTKWGAVLNEFFANSSHFPVFIIFLEILNKENVAHFQDHAPYYLLLAALVQAWFLGSRTHAGKPMPLLGNLIAPLIYTGIEHFTSAHDEIITISFYLFWGYAFIIGIIQSLRWQVKGDIGTRALIISENMLRMLAMISIYWLSEYYENPKYADPALFLSESAHYFMIIVLPLLGLAIGLTQSQAELHLRMLQKTAVQLRQYSEWLLGRELLERAEANPESLAQQRRERTVLFADIRGFTAWSEQHTPEGVVKLLDNFYETGSEVLNRHGANKLEYTGDEIMAIFSDPMDAATAAVEFQEAVKDILGGTDLHAGIGLNCGMAIEGLVGGKNLKKFSILGDMVNTGKRICTAADASEILVSESVAKHLGVKAKFGNERTIDAKGKIHQLHIYQLLGLTPATK